MTNPVEFGLAISNSHPSSTGSLTYEGSFKIVVQNLAFQKQVSIWAQVGTSWQDIVAHFDHFLPDNRELWIAPASNSEGEFVAKYTEDGITHWDNNDGRNYHFPQVSDAFSALAGNLYKVVLANAFLSGSTLNVNLGVQNLAFSKVVGIVFTTDKWVTSKTANAHFSSTLQSGLEVWDVTVPVGSATEVTFAIFYRVDGNEFWDNNFMRNYTVTSSSPHQQWGSVS